MTEIREDRFDSVARAKHDALVEIYAELEAAPAEGDDKALYQRQSASKVLLTHILMLRKQLHLDTPAGPPGGALDAEGYGAMIAALDEVGADG